jgi:hypothetical protein
MPSTVVFSMGRRRDEANEAVCFWTNSRSSCAVALCVQYGSTGWRSSQYNDQKQWAVLPFGSMWSMAAKKLLLSSSVVVTV